MPGQVYLLDNFAKVGRLEKKCCSTFSCKTIGCRKKVCVQVLLSRASRRVNLKEYDVHYYVFNYFSSRNFDSCFTVALFLRYFDLKRGFHWEWQKIYMIQWWAEKNTPKITISNLKCCKQIRPWKKRKAIFASIAASSKLWNLEIYVHLFLRYSHRVKR